MNMTEAAEYLAREELGQDCIVAGVTAAGYVNAMTHWEFLEFLQRVDALIKELPK